MRTRLRTLLIVLAPTALAQQPARNPFDSPADAEAGGRLYRTYCAYCHGGFGEGGRGPDLTTGQYRHGGSDAELYATVRNGIPGTEMPSVRASNEDVWRMIAFLRKLVNVEAVRTVPGDPAAGRAAYDKGKCAACHAIGTEGGALGPDLTAIGRRRGVQALRESLVKPEADVPINYRTLRITTRAGQTVTGIRLNEDDLSIQIRDSGGNLRSFLKTTIREMRVDKASLMPSYSSSLSATELQDLVAYLSSLRDVQ